MLQESFWVGRLVQLSTDHDYSDGISNKDGESDTVSRDDQVDSAAQDQQPEDEFRSPAQEHAASAFQADDIARDSGQRFPLASVDRSSLAETPLYWNEGTKPGTKPFFPRRILDNGFKELLGTHSGYQFLTSTMTRMIDNRVVTWNPNEESFDDTTNPDADLGLIPLTWAEVIASLDEFNGRNS